jgi:hypothetical protein
MNKIHSTVEALARRTYIYTERMGEGGGAFQKPLSRVLKVDFAYILVAIKEFILLDTHLLLL